MRIRCDQELFANVVQAAGRAVSPRATQPALTGILIKAEGEAIEVSGTDQNTSITARAKAVVDEAGSLLLPGRFLIEIMKALGPGSIALERAEGAEEAVIATDKSEFRLKLLSLEHYPERLAAEGPEAAEGGMGVVEIDGKVLEEAISQVGSAASTDDARPILTGVFLTRQGDHLRMVATDSYRLAIRDLPPDGAPASEGSCLLPARVLGEVARLVKSEGAEKALVRLGEREALFDVGEVRVATRLIEGEFPQYEKLIPQTYPNKLVVSKEEFLDSIRRVSTLAQQNTPVRVSCAPDGVSISVKEQDVGEASEQIPEAAYEGEELTVAFNPGYLREGVAAVPGERVSIKTIDELKAVLIAAEDSAEFAYLLMPIRV